MSKKRFQRPSLSVYPLMVVVTGATNVYVYYLIKYLTPNFIRITGNRAQAAGLLKIMEGRIFSELTDFKNSGGDVVEPKHLPWYPDKLAYQLNVTRKDIRRQEIYFRLHNFLVAETESGSISRQETVSMLPPLVLGVEPHHTVLDMCAAPGSKVSYFGF